MDHPAPDRNAYVSKVNGWTTMFGCGQPGNGILKRAACNAIFLGPINAPQEGMYWMTRKDGDGPIPVNTLYTEPQALFAEPLTAQSASGSNLMTVGVNHDTLLTVGWLDLSQEPQVLHVPDFSGRYYAVQFTDPFNVNFAYVGTRTTGTQAGDYLISGPGWKGQVPMGLTQISSPDNSVGLLGRALVYSDDDLPAAYELSKQIQLTPLSQWGPSQ